jgi:hypothetical protein
LNSDSKEGRKEERMYHYYHNTSILPKLLNQATRSLYTAADASAYSQRLNQDESGLWVRTFLISNRRNSRGWRADTSNNDQLLSIIGKPLVLDRNPLTGRLDHPKYDTTKSEAANASEHARHAIGTVMSVHYNPNNDSYYADSLITDPTVIKYLNDNTSRDGKIALQTSPQILYDPKTEQKDNFKNWKFSHLAVVSAGAYPEAQIVGTCLGNKETCHNQFQSIAVASEPEYIEPLTPSQIAMSQLPTAIMATALALQKQKTSSSAPSLAAAASASTSSSSAEFKLDTKLPSYGYGGFAGIHAPANGKRVGRLA